MERTHDLNRARPGAFQHATAAIRLFVENGYMALVNLAVSAWNWTEVADVALLAADLGVTSMKVGLVVPLGRAGDNGPQLALSHDRTRRLAMEMREIQERLKHRLSLQLDGLFPFLLGGAPETVTADDGCGPGCSAGVAQVVVSYDGSIYACPYLRGGSAGNIRMQPLKEIWENAGFFEPLRKFDRNRLEGKCG